MKILGIGTYCPSSMYYATYIRDNVTASSKDALLSGESVITGYDFVNVKGETSTDTIRKNMAVCKMAY